MILSNFVKAAFGRLFSFLDGFLSKTADFLPETVNFSHILFLDFQAVYVYFFTLLLNFKPKDLWQILLISEMD